MKEFWNMVQLIFAAVGGWLGYFLGGCDGLLIALVVFAVVDYITGVMCAVSDKELSSKVGFRGICRKVLIFVLVGAGHILDTQIIGDGSVLRGVPAHGGDLLLPLQRGCVPAGECRSSGSAHSEKAAGRSGADPRPGGGR